MRHAPDNGSVERQGLRVALLCPETRLRRILSLALRADGFDVVEWSGARAPGAPVAAVVADLDGLRWQPQLAITTLRALGVGDTTPLVLISVYPPEPEWLERPGPLEYLQPPFAPEEFAARVGRLLDGASAPASRRRGSIELRADAAHPSASDDAACSRAADV